MKPLRQMHAPLIVFAFGCALLDGCSKADTKDAYPAPNATAQAQAAHSSIMSAQAPHDDHVAGAMSNEGAAPSPSMAMEGPSGSPPMNTGAPAGGMPMGKAGMLGQPPMPGGATSGLPAAIGAPHLYHLGIDTFFLDRALAIGLTGEQQARLAALKENAAVAYATTQRKIDQGEQDLWVLSASEAPDIAKIETKIGEIARLMGQQRMDYIRKVGEAVGVLSDAQRKAVAAPGSAQPSTIPPVASASGGAMPPPAMPPPAMPPPGMGDM